MTPVGYFSKLTTGRTIPSTELYVQRTYSSRETRVQYPLILKKKASTFLVRYFSTGIQLFPIEGHLTCWHTSSSSS
jgi:hypothetical protein